MAFKSNNITIFFDRTSGCIAYESLKQLPQGDAMAALYADARLLLKKYYEESPDMTGFFVDPGNKKHSWYREAVDYKQYGLDWEQAIRALFAVYADCPVLFFSDIYTLGGDKQLGKLTPIVDQEFCRGDFRSFCVKKIEEEVTSCASGITLRRGHRCAAKEVYDLIRKTASYDDNKGSAQYNRYVDIPSHSILGYVQSRSAVCEGFSRTYQTFLNYLGIPAVTVTGLLYADEGQKTKSGAHARNFVLLSDERKWIMVDPTVGVCGNTDAGFDSPSSSKRYRRLRPEEITSLHDRYLPAYEEIWEAYQSREGSAALTP